MKKGGIDKAAASWPFPAVELHEDIVVEVEEKVPHEQSQQVVGGVGSVVQSKIEAKGEVCAGHHKQEDNPLKHLV